MGKKLAAALAVVLLLGCAGAAGAQADVTVMVYLCGSDLESENGCATRDIQEMLTARWSAGCNVVLQTGGADKWQNEVVRGGTAQRFQVGSDGLIPLETLGARDMTDPDTLSDFIGYCAKHYPARRYILILWDHGGGALYGYGSDESFPQGYMTLDELSRALAAGGVHFELLGFDACLMGTAETALAVADYADLLVASEETMPGDGLYYVGWLSALADDPAMDGRAVGRRMIDDYIAHSVDARSGDVGTLSMIDLAAYKSGAPEAIGLFAREALTLIEEGRFDALSRARGGAKAFGSAQHEMVDLIDLIARSGVPSAGKAIAALEKSVVYRKDSGNVRAASGLSVYFPYNDVRTLDLMLDVYERIGWSADYAAMAGRFANYRAGGQAMVDGGTPVGTGAGGFFSGLLDDLDAVGQALAPYEGCGWFSQEAIDQAASYVQGHFIPGEELTVREKEGGYVLSLSDADWDLVSEIRLNAFMDDGAGYIELGLDDVYDYDADGDLIVDFDYTWVALDGTVAPYYSQDYMESGDHFRYSGYVPALVNGRESEIVLAWDSEHDGGYVAGVRPAFSDDNLMARGLVPLADGDEIQLVCDYYDYDGAFDDAYLWGDPFTVRGRTRVTYEDIGDADAVISYCLTDIYGNDYWTETITYR